MGCQKPETSLYFDDDYAKINFGTDYSFNLGWMLDLRKTLTTKDQSFQVNGTEATYKQDNDLVAEITGRVILVLKKKCQTNII